MRPLIISALWSIVTLVVSPLWGQDVEQVAADLQSKLRDPFTYTGSLGFSLQHYGTSLDVQRAAPFAGTAHANLNLGILGVHTPLSFVFASGGTAFNIRLPSFGFAGMSPRYRDYTLHLGDRSLTLGKYSFSNHSFRGVGGEVNKEKWYTRFFYGRLQRAQISDFNGFERVNPIFRRFGWGGLIGLQPSESSRVEVSIFKGWDDAHSIPQVSDSSQTSFAKENVIISLALEQNIGNRIRLDFNGSNSGISNPGAQGERSVSAFRSYIRLLDVNQSTRWNNAYELKVDYKAGFGTLNVSYERIDPGYRTLGALFFQDDQENITTGITTQLFKRKVALVATGGIQNNNLAGDRAESYQRFVGSLQANATLSPKVNLNAGFSNFSSVNRQVRILDPSIPQRLTELALTNNNVSAGLRYTLNPKNILMGQFSWMKNQTITTTEQVSEQTNSVETISLIYNRQWPVKNLSMIIQGLFNHFDMTVLSQRQLGTTVSFNKSFREDLLQANLSLGVMQNAQTRENMEKTRGTFMQLRLGANWKVYQDHSMRLEVVLLNNSGASIQNFSESRLQLSYRAQLKPGGN